jgi:tetratricopeptide (TPR) repeat protein
MLRTLATYLAAVLILATVLGVLAYALFSNCGRYVPQLSAARIAAEAQRQTRPTPPPAAEPPTDAVADLAGTVIPAAAAAKAEIALEPPPLPPVFSGTNGNATADDSIRQIDQWVRTGAWDNALAACQELLKKDPKQTEVRIRYAGTLSLVGRDNDAWREAAAVLEAYPNDLRGHMLAASILLRKGLAFPALQHARLAAEAAPARPEAQGLLAQAMLANGDVADARSVLEDLVRTQPDNAEVLMSLGNVYAQSGQRDRALQVFEKVQELQPEATAPELAIGELNLIANRPDAAIANYRSVLAKSPANAVALNNLATLLFDVKGQTEEAMQLASQAWQLYPDSPQIADTLGWLYMQARDYNRATVLLGFAVRRVPRDPTLRYHLGAVLHARGMPEEAGRHLAAALALGVPFKDAERARELLDSIRKAERSAPPAGH